MQELERNLEEKENNNLRELKASTFQTNIIELSGDKHLRTKNQVRGLYDSKPPLPLQPMSEVTVDSFISMTSGDSIAKQNLFTFREPQKGEQRQCENSKEVGLFVKDMEQRAESELTGTCKRLENVEEYTDNLKNSHVPVTIKKEVRLTVGTTCLSK